MRSGEAEARGEVADLRNPARTTGATTRLVPAIMTILLALLVVSGPAVVAASGEDDETKFGPPPARLALVGARVITMAGEVHDPGTIVIDRGRIVDVGPAADVELPFDAAEVDVEGKVVMPGMINPHSWRGLDIPNENLEVAPMLDVYDAIDPSRLFFEEALRTGVTTVHVLPGNDTVIGGVGRAVRPIGLSPEEMTIRADTAMKMATSPKRGFDRMTQLATLRETFAELDHYLERLAEKRYEEERAEEGKSVDVGPEEARERGRELVRDEDYDDVHGNLVRLRRGDFGAWIYAGAAMDVAPALRITEEQGIEDVVLVLGTEGYKVADAIAEADVPVVLDADLFRRERDPLTGGVEEIFVPGVFADAGVLFALQPNPGASLAENYLNYQAAICVRNGLSRQQALEAITVNPARMLGIDDLVGTIEPGKVANLVVLSGDPLDFYSWVDHVYIDGILAYDRDRDRRLRELLRLERDRIDRDRAAEEQEAEQAEADADADAGATEDTADEAADSDDPADEGATEAGIEGSADEDGSEG